MILAVFLIASNLATGQTNVAGEWAVSLTVPLGEVRFTMLLVQKGERLSGHMLNETGQFPLEGVITGDQLKFDWTVPDGGKLVTVTFTGKAAPTSISGTAKAGDLGEGPMYAERRNEQ